MGNIVSQDRNNSSFLKVEEKLPVFYQDSKIITRNDNGQETFRLYYVSLNHYEAVLYHAEERADCLSLFRIEDEEKAREMFGYVEV